MSRREGEKKFGRSAKGRTILGFEFFVSFGKIKGYDCVYKVIREKDEDLPPPIS